jgi:hypothetical protein
MSEVGDFAGYGIGGFGAFGDMEAPDFGGGGPAPLEEWQTPDVKATFPTVYPNTRQTPDFSAYLSPERTVKEGRRQTSQSDIKEHGELSGEDWAKTFSVNYKKIQEYMSIPGAKASYLGKSEETLYKGYRTGQLATAYAEQKVEYGQGFSELEVDVENKRRANLAKSYQEESSGYFIKYQALYNVQANTMEKVEGSRRRVRLRERYKQMQIQTVRKSMRHDQSARKAGIASLVVNLSGTGLSI